MKDTTKDTPAIHPWVAAGQQKVRVGVAFMGPCLDWRPYYDRIQAAEALQFDSYWVPDHPTTLSDCWTLLAALAVTTQRIRLGTIVDCIFYRNPVLLARIAADVDRLSGGRLVLGLGMGDQPFEFQQMGLPFLSTRERQAALEETIEVVRGVWGASPYTYHGTYVQVEQAHVEPGPVQQPYVPLLIAGGGERVTLRQVAQYADASNFGSHIHTGGAATIADVIRKCDALRKHCEHFGRPVDAVLRTHLTLPLFIGETPAALAAKQAAAPPQLRERFLSSEVALTVTEAIAYYQALRQAGIQYFIIALLPTDVETMTLFSQQIMPALTS